MKDEACRMKRKEKIIRIVTEVLLLTNTWQSPHFYILHCDWLDSPEDENEWWWKCNCSEKRPEDSCHGRFISGLQFPRRISWDLLKQWSNLKCLHLLQLMILLLPFIPHTIYTIPAYLNCVHASTCYSVTCYRKNCFTVKHGHFIYYTSKG